MGVQKSRAGSVHKYTRFYVKTQLKKKKILIANSFRGYKYIFKFSHLVNLLLDFYLTFTKSMCLELFIEICIVYNVIQLIKQTDYFYTLGYFTNFIIFTGLAMLLCDLDLSTIFLWIIYGGVIIIFFLYGVMWSDINSINVFFLDFRLGFFLFGAILYIILIFSTDFYSGKFVSILGISGFDNIFFVFNITSVEELEMLGLGFFFFSIFYFILSTFVLFISCVCVVLLFIILKKFKSNGFINFLQFSRETVQLSKIIVLKNQFFFNQEYDSMFLKNSCTKIYKISVKFHCQKINYRRV